MKRLFPAILAAVLAIWALPVSAFAAVDSKNPEFQSFLKEIGLSEDEFITYFEDVHGYTLEDFDSVQEIKDYLGETINQENLKALLAEFGMTQKELEQLLEENGLSLDDFIFIEDLEAEIYYLAIGSIDEEAIIEALSEFGLTSDEIDRLGSHLQKVLENADEEAFLNRLLDLSERMMAFPDFDSASDLTPAQIAELLSIWDEFLNLFQLKVDYYLVKNGIDTPISISALIQMDTIDGADLLIKVFSNDGEFLADLLITKEMFGSDLITDTGKKISKAESAVKTSDKKPVVKTVKGGKLPNTAAGYVPQAAAGLALIILGAFLFRRLKVKGA